MASSTLEGSHSLRTVQRYSTTSLDPEIYANSTIEDLPCYHESISRNTAEALLLNNSEEGTFLIRRSESCAGDFSVSVRLTNSVKHFHLRNNGDCFTFGQARFLTAMQIWVHLKNSPILECDEGFSAHLLHPYISERRSSIPLPSCEYAVVTRQYETRIDTSPSIRPPSTVVLSKEGKLYKKKEGKGWKQRWFILNKNHLSFKKKRNALLEKKTLDLTQAIHVHETHQKSKENCFRIEFPTFAYVLSADSAEERDKWLNSIKWQIDAAGIRI